MIIISLENKEILKEYIDNIDELLLVETYEGLDLLLETIDDIILYNLNENDELDIIGLKLQPIYDIIARENKYY